MFAIGTVVVAVCTVDGDLAMGTFWWRRHQRTLFRWSVHGFLLSRPSVEVAEVVDVHPPMVDTRTDDGPRKVGQRRLDVVFSGGERRGAAVNPEDCRRRDTSPYEASVSLDRTRVFFTM